MGVKFVDHPAKGDSGWEKIGAPVMFQCDRMDAAGMFDGKTEQRLLVSYKTENPEMPYGVLLVKAKSSDEFKEAVANAVSGLSDGGVESDGRWDPNKANPDHPHMSGGTMPNGKLDPIAEIGTVAMMPKEWYCNRMQASETERVAGVPSASGVTAMQYRNESSAIRLVNSFLGRGDMNRKVAVDSGRHTQMCNMYMWCDPADPSRLQLRYDGDEMGSVTSVSKKATAEPMPAYCANVQTGGAYINGPLNYWIEGVLGPGRFKNMSVDDIFHGFEKSGLLKPVSSETLMQLNANGALEPGGALMTKVNTHRPYEFDQDAMKCTNILSGERYEKNAYAVAMELYREGRSYRDSMKGNTDDFLARHNAYLSGQSQEKAKSRGMQADAELGVQVSDGGMSVSGMER